MGKYSSLQEDIFSIFKSTGWVSENIKTHPSNFAAPGNGDEYIRVSIVAGKTGGANPLKSVSGQLLIDIFTAAGRGPKNANTIADVLDSYLAGACLRTTSGGTTQLSGSTLVSTGNDTANPSLSRSIYSISFNYFGI